MSMKRSLDSSADCLLDLVLAAVLVVSVCVHPLSRFHVCGAVIEQVDAICGLWLYGEYLRDDGHLLNIR